MTEKEQVQALLENFNSNLQQIAVLGQSQNENKEQIIELYRQNSDITSQLRKVCSHKDSSPLLMSSSDGEEVLNEFGRKKCNICLLYFYESNIEGEDNK